MRIKELLKRIIPKPILGLYHYALSFIGAVVFWFPSRQITVIGVTGTSGKSTTIDFISRVLEESGAKTASVSSVRFKIGQREWKNALKMTMPGRFVMQKFLRQAVNAQCRYAVLEVTSEGIKQYRHKFINFHTAVFTNLAPEHIESHGGFENYRNEKLKLFSSAKDVHIINIDDAQAEYFLAAPAGKTVSFGIHYVHAEVRADNANFDNGIGFSVGGIDFHLRLLGNFNLYNALAAIAAGVSQGIPLDTCRRALEKAEGIPGRMEIVAAEPFLVVVDYAHAPVQLESAYKSLAPKELICVLGSCGGGRDQWKRPVLGSIAGRYCKEVVVTNEDPYDEDPQHIINQVAEGAGERAIKVPDRGEAIRKAMKMAGPGSAVVITGKGSEPWMCIAGGKKIPWDDIRIAREALRATISPALQ